MKPETNSPSLSPSLVGRDRSRNPDNKTANPAAADLLEKLNPDGSTQHYETDETMEHLKSLEDFTGEKLVGIPENRTTGDTKQQGFLAFLESWSCCVAVVQESQKPTPRRGAFCDPATPLGAEHDPHEVCTALYVSGEHENNMFVTREQVVSPKSPKLVPITPREETPETPKTCYKY